MYGKHGKYFLIVNKQDVTVLLLVKACVQRRNHSSCYYRFLGRKSTEIFVTVISFWCYTFPSSVDWLNSSSNFLYWFIHTEHSPVSSPGCFIATFYIKEGCKQLSTCTPSTAADMMVFNCIFTIFLVFLYVLGAPYSCSVSALGALLSSSVNCYFFPVLWHSGICWWPVAKPCVLSCQLFEKPLKSKTVEVELPCQKAETP